MKLMFASDIHGSAYYAELVKQTYNKEGAQRLILLGDLLYHGPRNDLPRDYAPKKVIPILNELKNDILAVRGNCEAEVDQMVLEFPCLADYCTVFVDGLFLFITHGHIYNTSNPPVHKPGDILIHGHTHIQAMESVDDYIYINPGSTSIPKNGNRHSYMIYENRKFTIKDIEDGSVISEMIID
ncbi:MAG TPA: phosphodiesterase [Lachnospiraceae bacterium]|nr:phosphodiesterase [Lachnospiraceae bacterium]